MWRPLQTDGQALPGWGHAERALQASWWQEHGAAHAGGPRAQQAGKLETRALFAGSQGGTVAPAGGNTCAPRSMRLDLKASAVPRSDTDRTGRSISLASMPARAAARSRFRELMPLRPYGPPWGWPPTTPIDTREETIHNSPVGSKDRQNSVEKRTGGRSAPTTVNSSVRT